MGAWDSDPFGNDMACDWVYDVEKTTGLELIEKTLDNVLAVGDDYLDSFEAEQGIAAADTIARLRGHFYVRNAYTEALDKWVAKQKVEVPQELVNRAIQVVDRVMTEPSEPLELWEESGGDDWKDHLDALKERLNELPIKD